MSAESQEELDQKAMAIALAELEHVPVNPALRWYLWIIKLMPGILTCVLPILYSIVIRLRIISRLSIDGDWFALSYGIILLLSTFILGFMHAKLKRAMHPVDQELRNKPLWIQAIEFFAAQLLFVPATLVAIIAVLAALSFFF